MRKIAILLILAGLALAIRPSLALLPRQKKENPVKYVVVGSFNDVVAEFDDRDEAFETAEKLTLLGRIFPSKPLYFVLER